MKHDSSTGWNRYRLSEDGTKPKPLHIVMPPDLLDQIRAAAREEERPIAATIRQAVRYWLASRGVAAK